MTDAATAIRKPVEKIATDAIRLERTFDAPIDKVWDGFVSKEANRTIFMGADFDLDLRPGGAMSWSGPGKDGRPTRYVTGEVVRA